jgi:hypothetical protein
MKLNLLNMHGKNGKMKLFALGLGTIILLAALGLTVLTVANSYDPIANSGSPKTPLEPQSNVYPTPQPTPKPSNAPIFTPNPTPTPYQWNNPTPPPVETPAPTVTAEVWQTVYVTNIDGSTYWVNPPKPFALALLGSPDKDASHFKQVKNVQNNIYMKISSDKTVQSWLFSAKETIGIYNENGFEVGTIAKDATVNKNGYSVVNGQNTWVLGSSISAIQLEPLIEKVTRTQCYFVIQLSNIQLSLSFTDGTTEMLTADYGNVDNTLAWLIDTT